jgi:hypothetical protein
VGAVSLVLFSPTLSAVDVSNIKELLQTCHAVRMKCKISVNGFVENGDASLDLRLVLLHWQHAVIFQKTLDNVAS